MSGPHKMAYLVVIETQKVKAFVFASPIMRETRGASAILDRLNRVKTATILSDLNLTQDRDYEIVYLGGGSGRILFRDPDHAKEFRQKILWLYREKAVVARISVEIVKRRSSGQGEPEPISDWISRGIALSRRNKLGRSEGVPVVGGRWIRPCSSCGMLPASEICFEFVKHRLCRACILKRNAVKALYRSIKPGTQDIRVLESPHTLAAKFGEAFIFTTLARSLKDTYIRLPQDFNAIGNRSLPSNYMGFIYADGNQMGKVAEEIGRRYPASRDTEAVAAYRAFSEISDRATREAAVEAVLSHVVPTNMEDDVLPLPAEFIMAGGDDLMLAVPAHCAMDVAVDFIDGYRKKTLSLQEDYLRKKYLDRPFAPEGLTTSAGVVIAHAHYPVSQLMKEAEGLMKMAKKRAALESGPAARGTLDFMVISDAGCDHVKERRQIEYTRKGPPVIRLTRRPLTLEETRKLIHTIRGLKINGAPRNKLKALYEAVFIEDVIIAQFEGLRIKERLRATGALDNNHNPELTTLCMRTLNRFPFHEETDGCWSTPLTEIMELYDFIREKPCIN